MRRRVSADSFSSSIKERDTVDMDTPSVSAGVNATVALDIICLSFEAIPDFSNHLSSGRCHPTPVRMKPTIRVSSRAAFTLVELLTVIAIVGVLAAIIIPVVYKVRENARASQCTSNLRAVSSALLLYATENKNQLPAVATTWYPPANQKDSWLYKAWPYAGYQQAQLDKDWTVLRALDPVERSNIFICPSTQRSKLDTPVYKAPINPNVFCYGLNVLSDDAGAWMKSIRLSDVVAPGRTFMVTEVSFYLGTAYGYLDNYGLIPHSGGANFAFFDGHVERRAKASIPDYSTASNRRFWNGQ